MISTRCSPSFSQTKSWWGEKFLGKKIVVIKVGGEKSCWGKKSDGGKNLVGKKFMGKQFFWGGKK
jgi:hypothetical protein